MKWNKFNPNRTVLQKRWVLLAVKSSIGSRYIIAWDEDISRWVYLHLKVLKNGRHANEKTLVDFKQIELTHYFPLHDLNKKL